MNGKRTTSSKPTEKISGNHSVSEKKGAFNRNGVKALLQERSEFSGPLPPPQIFEEYERICPGAADRVLSMAESQSQHRQHIEKAFIFSRNRQSMAGTYIAGIVMVSTIIASTVLLLNDKNVQGLLLFLTTAMSILGGSIYGRYETAKQSHEKKED
ncbi:MAG: DUF2335 domain-containing protein [Clostridiaceae bacterium]